jgi:hypothetical protein
MHRTASVIHNSQFQPLLRHSHPKYAFDSLESRLLLSKTLYVDASSSAPTPDGLSWPTAYADLQQALTAAVSGDEIHVAQGTYKPTPSADRTISFNLKDGVQLFGGYAGLLSPSPDIRDWIDNPTILSGDIGNANNKSDNSFHVLLGVGASATASLDGFTITGGNANGTVGQQGSGGGLYAQDASPTLTNCTFIANATTGSGGGMYTNSSSTLTNCTFIGNSASAGGGIYDGGSTALPTVINCTFSNNSATTGGGMYSYFFASALLTGCTFSGNTASRIGGGMYNDSSSPTIANCNFSGNSAGAIYNSSSASSPTLTRCVFTGNSSFNGAAINTNGSTSLTLTNCIFIGNSATNQGGAVYNAGATISLINCTFNGNSAAVGGGGMYSASSLLTVTNCAFEGNTAPIGGGMYNFNSNPPKLNNCTFSGNTAFSGGGGIYNSGASPKLTNCIVWGNSSGMIGFSSSPLVTYSDIQGGSIGVGNVDIDPRFVKTPWTGPDGLFGTIDDDPGDLRLRATSPLRDAGSNAAVSTTTDLDGNARIQNNIVDIGAFEGVNAAPEPRVLYVDGSAIGANTGLSWSDAFADLQSALRSAGDGDTIRIADGTYKPTNDANRAISFALRNDVGIYAGYAGFSAQDPDARDPVSNPTIISGDIGAVGSNSDNSYHVLTATGIGTSTLLDGMSITLGNANGPDASQGMGGGMLTAGGSPTMTNCAFTANRAFSSNDGGAGIYNHYSSPILSNCTFSGNTASFGGGIFNFNSSPTLTNCVFLRNAADNGGAILNSSSSPTLINCIFSGNLASSWGGGMHNASSSPKLTNCLFSGNKSAIFGGAMYNFTSSPTLTNCTLSGNTAATGGGGIYNNSSSSPKLTNCIVWGNNSAIVNSGSSPVVTYSDVQAGYAGTGNTDVDPLFLRSPSPGPDAKWGTADDDYGDLHLRPNSPAIDAGLNSAVPTGTTTDLDNNPRISNGTIDMGAYEQQLLTPSPNDSLSLSSGSYLLTSTTTLSSLTLNNSANLFLSPGHNKTLILSNLTLSPTASLDLSDNDLILSYTMTSPEQTLQQYAQDALTSHNTHGLFASSGNDASSKSARTLAIFDNHDAHFTTFSNQPLSSDYNQVLAKYTYYGDSNADGRVDPTDYAIVDGNQGKGHNWVTGDLNSDGKVDPTDYAQIDGNQGAGFGNDAGPELDQLAAPAAEPALATQPAGTPVTQALSKAPHPQPAPSFASPFSISPIADGPANSDVLEESAADVLQVPDHRGISVSHL